MSTPASADGSHAMVNAHPHVQKYRPRACQGCTRAKLRCVWPSDPDSESCQRRVKSKVPCVLRDVNPHRRKTPSARVKKLEEKVDDILSLLKAGQQQSGEMPQRPELLNSHPSFAGVVASPASATSPLSQTPGSMSAATLEKAKPVGIDVVPGFRLTLDEAESALHLYRFVYTPYFPFVPIPATLTAQELIDTAPFLLRTILLITAPQPASVQRVAQMWFRQRIAQHVVVDQERRLELLQAILVFLAWGNFQFYIESQATDLLQLATVIVVDLGLDKSPESLRSWGFSFVPAAIRKVKGLVREGHTLNDMRAMLGCFYLNSLVATLFRRARSSGYYTTYLTHCCDKLLEIQEYDSDKLLVALVCIQQLLMRVSDTLPSPELHETESKAVDAPLHMILATTRKELDALVQKEPPVVAENALLWINYHGALMRLSEPFIHLRSSGSSPVNSTRRTEALSGCLQAARGFFTTYTAIPLDVLGSMPLAATAYMSFAIVTSSMLLLLDDRDWDASLARKTFDFAATCQSLGDRFREGDQMAQSLGRKRLFEEGGKSVLDANHTKIMWIRHWYLSKASPAALPNGPARNRPTLSTTATVVPAAQPMELDQNTLSESLLLPIDSGEAFWRAMLDPDGTHEWMA